MDKAVVCILTHNGKHLLEKFLGSVIENSQPYRVAIIDNASEDGTQKFINSHFPNVLYIRLDKNYGYAEGYNRGLTNILAKYYVLLNNDVEVERGWLIPIINFMDETPEIGALQPKIKSFNDRSKFEYAGAAGGMMDLFMFPFARGRILWDTEIDRGQYNDIVPVFWTSGACMVVRSDVFWAVGGFDTTLFAHMEEIDLCWRIHLAGFKCIYFPNVAVFHMGGGTLPYSHPLKNYYNFRNNIVIIRKNVPFPIKALILFIRFFLNIAGALYLMAKGEWRSASLSIKGTLEGYFRPFKPTNLKKMNPYKIEGCIPRPLVLQKILKL